MNDRLLTSFLFVSGVFISLATASAQAEPSIQSVSGDISEGSTLVLAGSGFSDKASGKPYFYWEADGGTTPSSLGRQLSWAGPLNGELSSAIVAPGSVAAFRFDHGSSGGAALAGVDFDSDKLYVFRKTYEDFNTAKDFAIRTRVVNLVGSVEVGQLVTGSESGATGVVQSIKEDGTDRWAIFYSNESGSIVDENPTDFVYGEKMQTSSATFTNAEGSTNYPTGTYKTFNFKTIRLWNRSQGNNAYVGTGRSQKYDTIPEYTDGKLWNDSWTIPLYQRPMEWKSEELYYLSSSIDAEDGAVDFRFDNKQSYDHGFQTRNADRPEPYNIIYQSQVSNGAQPASYIYYDHVYIDDSWHHVAVCNSDTWEGCRDKAIQVPTSWSDSEISIVFDPRHLDVSSPMYLYVSDVNGRANPNGFAISSSIPKPPSSIWVE